MCPNLVNTMASENLSMTMRVSQESESVGNTVNVKISLEDNPSVASIRVQVPYDDFLTNAIRPTISILTDMTLYKWRSVSYGSTKGTV